MRTYIVTVWEGGRRGREIEHAEWRSSLRIRQFVATTFRKYFGGRAPNVLWGIDGFMAEARSGQGYVMVDQVNWWHPFGRGRTLLASPCCPATREQLEVKP